MAFVVLPTGIPLVLGMPFFARFDPHILWRKRQFVIEQYRAVHVLYAEILPPAAQLSAKHTQLVPVLSDAPRTSSPVTLESFALVPTIQASTPTDTEGREIAKLRDKAQNRVIHGKFVPPPVQTAHLESTVPPPI